MDYCQLSFYLLLLLAVMIVIGAVWARSHFLAVQADVREASSDVEAIYKAFRQGAP